MSCDAFDLRLRSAVCCCICCTHEELPKPSAHIQNPTQSCCTSEQAVKQLAAHDLPAEHIPVLAQAESDVPCPPFVIPVSLHCLLLRDEHVIHAVHEGSKPGWPLEPSTATTVAVELLQCIKPCDDSVSVAANYERRAQHGSYGCHQGHHGRSTLPSTRHLLLLKIRINSCHGNLAPTLAKLLLLTMTGSRFL